MSFSFWSDKELGAAFDARDYKKMSVLIAKGPNFAGCYHMGGVGGFMSRTSALDNAIWKKDLKLIKFVVKHGGIIKEIKIPDSNSLFEIYCENDEKIYRFLCSAAYTGILKKTMAVTPEAVRSLLVCFGLADASTIDRLKQDCFLIKELFSAAASNEAKAVGRILKMLIRERKKAISAALYPG